MQGDFLADSSFSTHSNIGDMASILSFIFPLLVLLFDFVPNPTLGSFECSSYLTDGVALPMQNLNFSTVTVC